MIRKTHQLGTVKHEIQNLLTIFTHKIVLHLPLDCTVFLAFLLSSLNATKIRLHRKSNKKSATAFQNYLLRCKIYESFYCFVK